MQPKKVNSHALKGIQGLEEQISTQITDINVILRETVARWQE